MAFSETMLAARYSTAGPDQGTLSVTEMPRPAPAPGEVLVRVRVSGVNPTDWKSRRSGGNASVADEIVPNQDGAGEVAMVGDGVDPARVAKVLVHGGAGAVGHAAIELGRWHGAHVATTVSSEEKAELARAAAAELVVNYRSEPVADRIRAWAPDGVARIVEVNLPANLSMDTEVLANGGVVSCYTAPDRAVELSRSLMVLNAHVAFVLVYTISLEAKLAAVADISQALRDGALTALPAHRFRSPPPMTPWSRVSSARYSSSCPEPGHTCAQAQPSHVGNSSSAAQCAQHGSGTHQVESVRDRARGSGGRRPLAHPGRAA